MFQRGRHNSSKLLAVRSVENSLEWSRFAYAIPKRVGNAVVRNLIRRRLRHLLATISLKEGFDIVISVRTEAAKSSFTDLKTELELLLKRARLIGEDL